MPATPSRPSLNHPGLNHPGLACPTVGHPALGRATPGGTRPAWPVSGQPVSGQPVSGLPAAGHIRLRRRSLLGGLSLLALAACGAPKDLAQPPRPLGNFRLGYNIVVVDDPEVGPFSRTATDAEWKQSLEEAIAARFSRFSGSQDYHIAIKLQAYALAMPGVPLVFKPRSVLVVTANVWAPYGKLNPEPEHLTVWEGASPQGVVLGSGLTQTREEQMLKLSTNAAWEIEKWMRKHPEWFTGDFPPVPGTEPKPSEDAADGAAGAG